MKSRLDVVHITPLLFGEEGIRGGAERYAYELALAMSQRHATKLVTFGPEAKELSVEQLRIQVLKPHSYPRQQGQTTKINPLSVKPLVSSLRDSDIIVCHQQNLLSSTIAACWGRLTRRRVFTIPLGGAGWDLSSYISTDRLFSGILHISEFSRKLHGHQNWPRSHVIYAGVNREQFYRDPGVSKDDSVLFVGRFLPHKGIDILLRAVPSDMPCFIVGTPKGQDYFRHLQELAAGKNVQFMQHVGDEELRRLYQRALCVVLPSVCTDMYGSYSPWSELLGQTVLEAMVYGTVAVASDIGAFPEMIEDGKTGCLHREGDADSLAAVLSGLRDNPSRSAAIANAGYDHVQSQWTWERVLDRCDDVFLRDGRRI
ncbi:MAG: glycosyltransferase family 4 protein [Planctomycetaceae bacterium]